MKIFFDTEFTGLHKNTTLISIGMVTENGRSFYAEMVDYDRSQVDDWIKKNVVKNLFLIKDHFLGWNSVNGNTFMMVADKEELKKFLPKWFMEYGGDNGIQLVSDVCYYDMVLFQDIFGGAFGVIPKVLPVCHDINQDIARFLNVDDAVAFDVKREDMVDVKRVEEEIGAIGKHNALWDAHVIKAVYEKIFQG